MKKFLLILSVMCLMPFFVQAQKTLKSADQLDPPTGVILGGEKAVAGSENRPVSQFSSAVYYDDVKLDWIAPTSNEIKYYHSDNIESEVGEIEENEIWMAIRVPQPTLSEYPSSEEFPFSLEYVKFMPSIEAAEYQVCVYTSEAGALFEGDFSATLVGTYDVTDVVANEFNYVAIDPIMAIDQTKDLIIAIKVIGADITTLRYDSESSISGLSNLISLDGTYFEYVYEDSNSRPVNWFIGGLVSYPNEDGQKGTLANVNSVDNMSVYRPAGFAQTSTKDLPSAETVVEYILSRDGEEIATVDGDVLTYFDKDLPHETHTYTYGIVTKYDNDLVSRMVTTQATLSFCPGDDNVIRNLQSFVNIEERAITVSWDEPVNSDVVDYRVLVYNPNNIGFPPIRLANTQIHEYTLSGMPSGDFVFCIYANYGDCMGDMTCTDVLTLPEACGYPVSNFVGVQGTHNIKEIKLSWIAPVTSHEIAGYTIDRYKSVAGILQFDGSFQTTDVTYVDSDVELNGRYKYSIVVNYVNDCYSTAVLSNLVHVAINKVTNLQAELALLGEVTLTWTAPTQQGLTGYNVYVNGVLEAITDIPYYIDRFPAGDYEFGVTAVYSNQYESGMVSIDFIVPDVDRYTIQAIASPVEGGSVVGAGVYLSDMTANMQAIPSEGYDFINWTEYNMVVSTDAEYSFTVTEDRNLVANFAARNVLTVSNVESHIDVPTTISVSLNNEIDEVVGFQFDIPLGDNLTYVDGSCVLTDRTSSAHNLYTSITSNNALRILVYSFPSTALLGTDGAIITFDLIASEIGVHSLTLENSALSDAGGTSLYVLTQDGSMTVNDALSFIVGTTATPAGYGTTSGDGVYNYGVTATVTAQPNEGYFFVDWMENDVVVSTDAEYSFVVTDNHALVANFIPNEHLSVGAFYGHANQETEIGINYTNTINQVVGFQVDIPLDEHLTYVDGSVALTDRAVDQLILAQVLEGNVLRILSYSMQAQPFTGNDGILFTFDVIASQEGVCPLSLSNAVLSDALGHVIIPTTSNGSLVIDDVLIDVVIVPVNGGTIEGLNSPYFEGETVSLNAVPNSDYVFINWTEGGSVVSSDPEYTFLAENNRTLNANFAVNNVLSLSEEIGKPNSPITMSISLDNKEDVVGFQTDVALGNFTYIDGSVTLTSRASVAHQIFTQVIEGNILRIIDYSMPGSAFSGNSGAICTFDVIAEDIEDGVYPMPLSNTFLSDAIGNSLHVSTVDGNIFVSSIYIYANANPTLGGTINGQANFESAYLFGETVVLEAEANPGFEFLYWTDENGVIVSNGTIYSFQVFAERTFTANFALNNVITLSNGFGKSNTPITMSISLDNLQDVAGFQTEIALGDFTYIDGSAVLTNRASDAHTLTTQILEGNILRITDQSMPATPYSGNSGAICTFEVIVEEIEDGVYPMPLSNTYLLDPMGASLNVSSIDGSISISTIHVYANANPTIGGTINGVANFDGIYAYGETVVLEAEADPDYEFINWTDENGNFVSSSLVYSFKVFADCYFTANFAVNNVLSLSNENGKANTPITMSISLDNKEDVVGFQTDIALGEFTYIDGSAVLTSRATAAHNLFTQVLAGNILRIIDYSMPPASFTGNSGAICTFDVIAEDIEDGVYPMPLSNTYLSDAMGASLHVNSVDGSISLSSIYVYANVNPANGGTVNGVTNFEGVYDSGETAVLEAEANPGYIFLNWTDQNGVIVSNNLIYIFQVYADCSFTANFAINNVLSLSNEYGKANTPITMSISLDNNEDVVGFQTDIALGEFTYIEGSAALTSRAASGHVLYTQVLEGNILRILDYSMPSTPFTGNEGSICTFDVIAEDIEDGVYPMPLSNTYLSDEMGASLHVSSVDGSVHVSSIYVYANANPTIGGTVNGVTNFERAYDSGETVVLEAEANPGYIFLNWTDQNGDIVSNNLVYIFQVYAGCSFTANFAINNVLSLSNENGKANTPITMSITLDNNEDVVGFQTDIALGEFTYIDGSAALTSRASSAHVLYTQVLEGNILRILDYSMPPASFTGNEGAICTFDVIAEEIEDGVYPMPLSNTYLSDAMGASLHVSTVDGSVSVSSIYVYANANPTTGGTVNGVTNFERVYGYGETVVLEAEANPGYIFLNWTDQNGDVVSNNLFYFFQVYAGCSFTANFAVDNVLSISNEYGKANTPITMSIALDNNEDVVGFQTDIALGEFTYIEGSAVLTSRASSAHVLYTQVLEGNILRILDYSMPPASFTGNEGAICTFDVIAEEIEDGVYPMPLSNTYLSDAMGASLHVSTVDGSVSVSSIYVYANANPTTGGTVNGVTNFERVYGYGETVVLEAEANPGYIFLNWTDQNGDVVSNNLFYFFQVYAGCSFTANFAVDNVLSLSNENGKANTPITMSIALNNNEDVVGFQTDIALGEFTYIEGSAVLTSRASSAHVLYTQVLEGNILRILDYSMPPASFTGNEGAICTFDVIAEEIEDGVYPMPLSNTYLSDATGNSLAVNTVDGSISMSSIYVYANVNPAIGGTVNGEVNFEGVYYNGETVVLEAVANPDYLFLNWTDQNGNIVSNNTVYIFEVSDDCSFTANFAINNVLSLSNENGKINTPITMSISLDNKEDVVGFQTDIALGEFTYIEGSAALTSRASSAHVLYTQVLEGNILRILDYSMPPASFTGNEGAICTFDVIAEEIEDGVYPMPLSNTYLSDATGNSLDVRTVDGSISLLSISIYANANPNDGGTVNGVSNFEGVYAYGELAVLEAEANLGYEFINWTDANGTIITDNQFYNFQVYAENSYTANFDLIDYQVSAVVIPAQSGTVSGVGTFNYGETAVLTAVPAENYVFDYWAENGVISTDPVISFTVTTDRNLAAVFKLNTVSIITHPYSDDLGLTVGDGDYEYGSNVTVQAYPYHGFSFKNWKEGDEVVSTDETYTFVAQDNRILIAHFNLLTYTLEVSADPVEGGTVDGGGVYGFGEIAHIVATSHPGYTFENWTTSDGNILSNGNETWLLIVSDCSFIAHFTLDSYNVTAHVNPAEAGIVTGVSNPYGYNELATLTATPTNDDYDFFGWSIDGVIVSTEPVYTFNVLSDIDIIAHFNVDHGIIISTTANNDEYGIVSGSGTYPADVNVTINAYPYPGYKFVNWTEDGNVITTDPMYTFTTVIGNDRSFVGNFELDTYTITAIADPVEGGTISGAGEFTFGQTVTLTATVNEGYRCLSWTDENGSIVAYDVDSYSFIARRDRTITAHFALINYTVSTIHFPLEGGTTSGDGVYAQGQIATVNAIPNTGYLFDSWYDNQGNLISPSSEYSFTVTSNLDLVAVFQLSTVVVYTNPFSEEAGFTIGDGSYLYGSNVSVYAYPLNGYSFSNWKEGDNIVSTDATYTFVAQNNRILVAHFNLLTYTVTVSANPVEGGTVEGGGDYEFGDIAHIVATENPGYTFVNWTTINGNIVSNGNEAWLIIISDCSFFANFTLDSYNVTAYVNPAEAGIVTGVSNPYGYNESATLTATPTNEDYVFYGWSIDGVMVSTDPVYTFNVLSVINIIANFNVEHGVIISTTANNDEYGIVSGSGTYPVDVTVTINAYPYPGYKFVNWTEGGNVITTDPLYTFTTETGNDRAFVGNFELETYTITAIADPAEGGTISGAGEFTFGQTVTLTATVNEGYRCLSWTDENGSIVAYGVDSYSFITRRDRTITAHFELITYTVTTRPVPSLSGITSGDGVYTQGQNVTINAIPNTGYLFDYWFDVEGNVISTEAEYSFTVVEDVTYLAKFIVNMPVMYPAVVNLTEDHENLTAELSWEPAEGAQPDLYVIEIIKEGNVEFSLNSYETTTLVKFREEGDYTVVVQAYYGDGISEPTSLDISIKVNDIHNFRISNTYLNRVDLTWDPCPGDRYNDFIRYEITRGSEVFNIYDINDTTMVDYIDVAGNYEYCIRIFYGIIGNVSTDFICHEITLDHNGMFPPVTLIDPNPVNLTASLSWLSSVPEAVLYYNIYVDNVLAATTTSTTCINKFSSEGLHTVSVEAIYEDGISNPAQKYCIIDVNEVPTFNAVQNSNHIVLSWSAPVDTYSDFEYYTITLDGDVIAQINNRTTTTYEYEINEGYRSYDFCITSSYVYRKTSKIIESQPTCKSISVSEIFPPVPYIYVEHENVTYVATWDAMPNAVSYDVLIDGTLMTTTVNPIYTAKSMSDGAKYIAVIVNYNNGVSPQTGVDFILSLNSPKDLAADVDGHAITLSWSAPADKYNDLIGYVLNVNGVEVINLGPNTLSYIDYRTYGTYEYCIKAQYGTDLLSSADCIDGITPECPTVVDFYGNIDYTTGYVTLHWSAPRLGTYTYNVYRNGAFIVNVSEPTYVDKTIDSYDNFAYTISVVCNDGIESDPSIPFNVSFACGDTPVKDLSATYDNSNGIPTVTLTWNKPLSFINGQLYNIYRQGELIASNYDKNVYYDEFNLPSGMYTYTVTEVCQSGNESNPSVTTVTVETGIDDISTINVSVYPNPTAGDVTVSCDNIKSVVVYNSIGQVVRTITVNNQSDPIVVSTSDFTSGVYIFNITNADGISVQKRVVVTK